MALPRVGVVALALVASCVVAAPLPAQLPQASEPVAALKAVMQFRIFWLKDETPLAACTAFNALGRPSDFPAGLDSFVIALLDQDPATCTATPGWRNPGCPVLTVERYSFADSLATVELRLNGHYSHRELYVLKRRFLDRTGNRYAMWGVQNVTMSGMMTYSGGPICRR